MFLVGFVLFFVCGFPLFRLVSIFVVGIHLALDYHFGYLVVFLGSCLVSPVSEFFGVGLALGLY